MESQLLIAQYAQINHYSVVVTMLTSLLTNCFVKVSIIFLENKLLSVYVRL